MIQILWPPRPRLIGLDPIDDSAGENLRACKSSDCRGESARWLLAGHQAVAEPLFQRVLTLQRKIYGDNDPSVSEDLSNLGLNVGNMHPFVALAWNLLGVVALKQGRLDEAEADFGKIAQIYRSVYGDKNFHSAVALSRFGELAMARKQYSQAEKLFQQSVQIFSGTLSPDNFKTGVARVELGGALLREERYPEAEAQLLAGYKIVTSEDHSATEEAMDARRDLVALYDALNQPEKAAKFRAELLASRPTAVAVNRN